MKKSIYCLSLILLTISNFVGCSTPISYNDIIVDSEKISANSSEVDNNKSISNQERITNLTIPEWSKDAVIYEVNVRQYTKEGTFKAFEEHLPRLKELGVDVLWFMPIHPISKEKRLGSLGSYYSIKDYRDVNPEFGTLDDFKSLVDKCHDMGFKVILDWVANHSGWDNPWILNPDWYTTNSEGKIIHPAGTTWEDVADLNFDNQDMRDAMLDAMIFWVQEIGVDGYRADYASGVPLNFWETVRSELDKIKPVYMLAEDDKSKAFLQYAFNSNYGWDLHHIMNKVAKGQNNAGHIAMNLRRIETRYPEGTYPMNFITNHDENSWAGSEFERMGDAVKAMATLTFTVPGIPLIYSGQEASLDKRLAFFDKDEISWDNTSMQDFYKELILLKKANQALWNGTHGGSIKLFESNNNNILAFEREKDDNKVIVIMNLSSDNVTADVKVNTSTGLYKTYPANNDLELPSELTISLAPWEYLILTK